MEHKIDLFISTGEVSGDLLAASFVKHLDKNLSIGGITGPELRKLGVKQYFPMDLFEIHGFSQLLKGLPRILRNYSKIKRTILNLNPKVVVFVDNAEFSLLMAKSLRKSGYKGKIVQLVCPTTWAWRKNRQEKMVKNLDLVLALFPNEPEVFAKTTLEVEFIGHPLIDRLKNLETLPREKQKKVFALFPGSRSSEIKLNFPIQLRAAKLIQKEYEVIASAAKPSYIPLLKQIAKKEGVAIQIQPPAKNRQLMCEADLALAKCGTTIFELGILKTPTIVMYKMSKLDILFGHLFKIFLSHYSLPNILLNRRIFPEYIGHQARQNLISKEVVNCAHNKEIRTEMRNASQKLSDLYQNKDAGKKAALKILDLLLLPS